MQQCCPSGAGITQSSVSSNAAPWDTLLSIFGGMICKMSSRPLTPVRNQMRGNSMKMRKALGGLKGKSCFGAALAF